MSNPTRLDAARAAELRAEFDRSFAMAPSTATRELEDLLAVRVADAAYAIRLRDLAGIVSKREIVSVPSSTEHLLGLVGLRGEIVPVFGLASILGDGAGNGDEKAPAWLVVCGAEAPIALGFSQLEGFLRVPKAALRSVDAAYTSAPARGQTRHVGQYVSEIAESESGLRPVIALPLIVTNLRNRLGHSAANKEP